MKGSTFYLTIFSNDHYTAPLFVYFVHPIILLIPFPLHIIIILLPIKPIPVAASLHIFPSWHQHSEGIKNYLFAGSHEAAQRSAMLYSLLSTCKMQGIEPYAWLRKTLETIATHPINRIKELLPLSE